MLRKVSAMRGLYIGYILVLLCQLTLALWINTNKNNRGFGNKVEDPTEEKRLLEYLRNVKRTNWIEALCGHWEDWCLPDSSKPGLTCCRGYTCKCNLWNTNCRCKTKLFSGK